MYKLVLTYTWEIINSKAHIICVYRKNYSNKLKEWVQRMSLANNLWGLRPGRGPPHTEEWSFSFANPSSKFQCLVGEDHTAKVRKTTINGGIYLLAWSRLYNIKILGWSLFYYPFKNRLLLIVESKPIHISKPVSIIMELF